MADSDYKKLLSWIDDAERSLDYIKGLAGELEDERSRLDSEVQDLRAEVESLQNSLADIEAKQ